MASLQQSWADARGGLAAFPIAVLLVDDQLIIGEAVRRMVAEEPDITFHFCNDPGQAIETARRVRPTVILQDLVMPGVDGLTLVKRYRADASLSETPLIVLSSQEEPVVKAESFRCGANDYLVKLPDRIELLARIRYHSASYIRLLERNHAYAELAENRQRLAEEIGAAAHYLRSLLPAPSAGPVAIDWRYVPSTDLGGDTFGYDWLDADHLALYIIDVTGHGLASALLAVSIMNLLRSRSLPNADFHDPAQVLSGLNDAFLGEACGEKFFTIWYGVYRRSDRTLRWAGGGHPPSLLFCEGNGAAPTMLDSENPVMGIMPNSTFTVCESAIPARSRLYLYTDGCQEIHLPDGGQWPFDRFIDFMARSAASSTSVMDDLLGHVRRLNGGDSLLDDFSIIEAMFP
jgi:sigma-B regulation protein RsbU (phosphoserine phosphatase)